MKIFRFLFRGAFVVLLALSFAACDKTVTSREPQSEFIMGTICTINLFEKGKPEIYSKVFARLQELEQILSANTEGTDLDTVNKNAGLEPVKVRPELIQVLGTALEYAEKSGGFFDPSIGPLVKLWGIGSDNTRIPEEDEIRQTLNLVNFREIELNQTAETVFLKRAGMALDLGAIAKGYAADETVKILAAEGVERAIIDLGGNIFAMGEKTGAENNYWRIGIQDPGEGRGNYLGIVQIKNKTVVTSGIYERFFEEGGKHYHHILSAENGFPVENGLISVTIIADTSIDADALSTSAFTLGWERGRDLIATVKNAEGIFVFNDLSVRLTDGIKNDFTLTAMEYKIANEK